MLVENRKLHHLDYLDTRFMIKEGIRSERDGANLSTDNDIVGWKAFGKTFAS